MNRSRPQFKRIVLKLSGEALMGDLSHGISPDVIESVAAEICSLNALRVQVLVVVGGGNIFRGLRSDRYGFGRVAGDHMGMLATMINSIALGQAISRAGHASRVMSAFETGQIAPPYSAEAAEAALYRDEIIIVGGGTGNPFFTTDTAAVLRAAEIGADAVLKATKVDGVYDDDPVTNPSAGRFDSLTYREAIRRGLKIMDMTAISLAMDRGIPIIVFDLNSKGSMAGIVAGKSIGSLITGDER